MKLKKLLPLILAIGLVGCATPAKTYKFDKTRTYNQSFDQVWTKLVKYYAMNNIEIKNLDKASGIIVAEQASFSPSLASCPSSFALIPLRNNVKLNVFIEHSHPVKVTVNTKFTQVAKDLTEQLHSVQCNSTGAIETEILNAL